LLPVNVKDFGAKGDFVLRYDGTLNGNVFTCPGAPFASSDVGKVIVVKGAGVGGAPLQTTIAGYNDPGSVTLTVGQTDVANVLFGFGTDDNAAVADASAHAIAEGEELYFPKGMYGVQSINRTNAPGAKMRGSGGAYGPVTILPIQPGTANYSGVTDSWSLVDCCGSPAHVLEGIKLGFSGWPVRLGAGVLHMPSEMYPGMDFVTHRDVQVMGDYTRAALYMSGCADCCLTNSAYWNVVTNGGAGRFGIVLSRANVLGMPSYFVPLGSGAGIGDIEFVSCEAHIGKDDGTKAVGCYSMLQSGAADVRFKGRNMSSTGNAHIKFQDEAGYACTLPMLLGVTFYAEGGPSPTHILENPPANIALWGCDNSGGAWT
jgi:hypothetical protein